MIVEEGCRNMCIVRRGKSGTGLLPIGLVKGQNHYTVITLSDEEEITPEHADGLPDLLVKLFCFVSWGEYLRIVISWKGIDCLRPISG